MEPYELPPAPGIEPERLLEPIEGDPHLYGELPGKLDTQYRGVPARIRIALAQDPVQAARLDHTWKGAVAHKPLAILTGHRAPDSKSVVSKPRASLRPAETRALTRDVDGLERSHLIDEALPLLDRRTNV